MKKEIENKRDTERLRKILNGNITDNLKIVISYQNNREDKNEKQG